jgi:Cytochrome P460
MFGAVYLNDVARASLTQTKPFSYRQGAVIVREKLETEAGSPELLTAMIKRKKGFNPEVNDWEFLVISGDATKIQKREKTGACQSCHSSASAKDFVFDSYLPVSTTVSPVMSNPPHDAPAMLQFGALELLVKQPNHGVRF